MGQILVEYRGPTLEPLGVTPWASNVQRSWVRNDIGTASFELPATTPNLLAILEWGNIIYIHEEGVPTWVGQIKELSWTESGVEVSLKSAETLLKKRLTKQGLFSSDSGGVATNGAIAYSVFLSAVVNNDPLRVLSAGLFDASTTRFKLAYDYADAFDTLQTLATEDDADFWVDENLAVHFRNVRGDDLTSSIVLREGRHLVDVKVVEQGDDLLTAAVVMGDSASGGTTTAERTKSALIWNNKDYFAAELITVSGVTDAAKLRSLGEEAIASRALPRVAIDADLVKLDDGTWGGFFVGDIVQIVLSRRVGVTSYRARCVGLELGALEDRMRCVWEVEEGLAAVQFTTWSPR